MILLPGGTSETAPLAEALAKAGFEVLVSTATDVPLEVGDHPGISHRSGPLDLQGMERLVAEHGIKAIVDASHPYASTLHAHARKTAEAARIPYLAWSRPGWRDSRDFVTFAANHEEAARIAFSFGKPILLTTGSRNLLPYTMESARTSVPLAVRVLNHRDSMRVCEEAGVPAECIIAGRGPFSVEENLSHIRKFRIGVIVTKDSGPAGGVPEKAEAARLTGCRLVVVQRPNVPNGHIYDDVTELISALKTLLRIYPP